jgi:16S rRNA (uracil1498-N3)-methyltransferase
LTSEYLSDIELYYINLPDTEDVSMVTLRGDEVHHIAHVMKHRAGDSIKCTDGQGRLFDAVVEDVKREEMILRLELLRFTPKPFGNITIGIPILKNNDRMETALEKCIELGFTNFFIFPTVRSTNRKLNTERFEKIAISAMKQSLNLYKPEITVFGGIREICEKPDYEIITFDVRGTSNIREYCFKPEINYVLLFGPEGGLSPEEVQTAKEGNRINLINTRLRTETAIIYSASVIKLLS